MLEDYSNATKLLDLKSSPNRSPDPPIEGNLSMGSARAEAIKRLCATLRPGQQQMADWQGGPLAVSAVPGAGKSTGMAVAAAMTIARYQLHQRRQLIVVTFTRSAAANIKVKIREYLRELALPQGGFTVHTLHGLALNIAHRYPELSQLDLDNSTLITPALNHRLIRACVEQWIADYPRHFQKLIEGQQFDGEEAERLRRQSVLRTEILPELASIVIHEAKSSGLTPHYLRELSYQKTTDEYGILQISAGLYERYQNLLISRNLIDYDEMILGALRVLENPQARQIEQAHVFAVFEDEAQDSTPLQSRLLEILADGTNSLNDLPNLIRVGDPNQAINSTFTPADPIYFRRFCQECARQNRLATMNQAGRSSQIIIEAANFVLHWVNSSRLAGTEQPFSPQNIEPVIVRENNDASDQLFNPLPIGLGLEICTPNDIIHTVQLIAEKVGNLWGKLPSNGSSEMADNDHLELTKPSFASGSEQSRNAAVLVRENRQGRFIAEVLRNPQKYNIKYDLRAMGIEIYDVAERDRYSQIPGEILKILQFVDRPHSSDYLKGALKILADRQLIPHQDFNNLAIYPEQFLYPNLLDPLGSPSLIKSRNICRALLDAKIELPVYQLISFIGLSLGYDRTALATIDKLVEKIVKQAAGEQTLTATIKVLGEIINSEKFDPVDADSEPEKKYKRDRQLTIITMHKAKGLDWDLVFIPFLQAQNIPGNLHVLPQAKFIGDFTLAEVARAQIRANLHGEKQLKDLTEAWQQAGYLKIAEELRLLYVAMTRAKSLLWMAAEKLSPFTWNKTTNLQSREPCPVFVALQKKFPANVVKV